MEHLHQMSEGGTEMRGCFKCIYFIWHFSHDDGTEVTGWLQADPNCQLCLNGEEHIAHDREGFSVEKAYGVVEGGEDVSETD